MEVILVNFLDTVATIDVPTANNNDVKPVETRTVHFAWLLNGCLDLLEQTNTTATTRVGKDFITCLPPEILRDTGKDGGYRK